MVGRKFHINSILANTFPTQQVLSLAQLGSACFYTMSVLLSRDWIFFIYIRCFLLTVGLLETEKKMELNWAKLSQSSDFGLIQNYLNMVEISPSKCLNIFLKLTYQHLSLCLWLIDCIMTRNYFSCIMNRNYFLACKVDLVVGWVGGSAVGCVGGWMD